MANRELKQHLDLKNLCARYGYNTQAEIAEVMGTKQQNVAYLLNNSDTLGMAKLKELCEAIGCNDMREAFTLPDGSQNNSFLSNLSKSQEQKGKKDNIDYSRFVNIQPDEVICPNCGKVLKVEQRNIAIVKE